jgi:hypothetical protein
MDEFEIGNFVHNYLKLKAIDPVYNFIHKKL